MWFLIFHRFLLQDWLQYSLVEVWSENIIPSQIVMVLGLIDQRKTTNVGPNKELPPTARLSSIALVSWMESSIPLAAAVVDVPI